MSDDIANNCLEAPLVDATDAIAIPWIMIYLFFRFLNAMIEEIALADQYYLLGDDAECKKIYDSMDKSFKHVCPRQEIEKMRLYQRKLFKLRLVKNLYSMLYDMAFIYFLMPKFIWGFVLYTFHSW